VFHSVVDLRRAINDYLEIHNADPKPFVCTASSSSIIEKVNRGKEALESQHSLGGSERMKTNIKPWSKTD
jgi:hypothetical protein